MDENFKLWKAMKKKTKWLYMHIIQTSILDRSSWDKLRNFADNHLSSNTTNKKLQTLFLPLLNPYPFNNVLRWFLSIALRIPTAQDFRVISAWARARTKRKRFPFSLNEHGDPSILFHNFNESSILNTSKKIAEVYGYFFGKWNKYYKWRRAQQRMSKLCFL